MLQNLQLWQQMVPLYEGTHASIDMWVCVHTYNKGSRDVCVIKGWQSSSLLIHKHFIYIVGPTVRGPFVRMCFLQGGTNPSQGRVEQKSEKERLSLVKLCVFNNTVHIFCIQKDGETVSNCTALTSSPESAHTLQFATKYHMFSCLVGIKIYIVVPWSVSESVPLPLPSPAGHEERPILKIAHSYWNLPSHNYKFSKYMLHIPALYIQTHRHLILTDLQGHSLLLMQRQGFNRLTVRLNIAIFIEVT